jgi:hypothetical protein
MNKKAINNGSRVASRDLYRLRSANLEAERQTIMVQLAQNRFKTILLGLELRYSLLASEATLDINTGQIRRLKEEAHEPGGHEDPGAPGPER